MSEQKRTAEGKDSGGTKKPPRRQYDEAYRRQAVALCESTGEPLSKIAAQLGCTHWNLRDWLKRGRRGEQRAGETGDLREVVVRLQKELEALRAERDILKKAMGILATPRASGTRS